MKFGNYLRECREGRGWSQPEAADRIGIEQSYLSKLETGRSYPSGEMFGRLADAYGIDTGDLVGRLPADEIEKLREAGEVRAAIVSLQRRAIVENRRWLIAGVTGLVLAGGCAGLALKAETTVTERHLYRSLGVLSDTEQLDAFDEINAHLPDGGDPRDIERRERIENLLERLDPAEVVTAETRGSGFVETSPEGRRYYRHVASSTEATPSPLGWFFIPALMFLGGAMGCFVAAFRWR